MRLILPIALALMLVSCSPADQPVSESSAPTSATAPTTTVPSTTTSDALPPFAVSSPDFEDAGMIPVEFTCDGADISPQLAIVGVPPGTNSLTIIVEDPDAPLGTFYHWVEFDIPARAGSISIPQATGLLGVPGVNSFNLEGYKGPCPPAGEEHTYSFHFYALGETLDLPPGVGAEEVLASIEGRVLDSTAMSGVYAR